MSEKEIQTIYNEDLPKLLTDLGLKEDFDNSKIKCEFCGDTITLENFFSIFSDGKKINFSCNKNYLSNKESMIVFDICIEAEAISKFFS